ncbi:filamentous hemagglutinin family outer membrane protein [Nostoc commune NIES-4072]|uniref:Filamentous hemagglutinin family outer membrane protein n=1 Tax=Nostoc commune NIES-4072 TaxID=2005467 RepID=A0A2R5FWH9_NOSCO|nr:S-layer family protein [Nostoc commune]BBD68985.1 filamentous hemagglutinin family outer membrane protein [Nostoc commune HK-02]GBG20014.1 filamentous hemagglutinin family outer membrane protein [Nostoc commune NIES-4072]
MKAVSVCWNLANVILTGGMLFWCGFANAQVSADGTVNTTVSQSGNNFTITNGSAANSNLFHSFQQFTVPTGTSAIFDLINTPNISSIFSRVTGGSISHIDGVIQTINNNNPVSLFLLNPSGIVFGPNAQLNIGGSFVGTTANSIKFADGVEFNATNTTVAPLLTINVPVGLQFGQNSGAIAVQNSINSIPQTPLGLQLSSGKTLALLGNGIDLAGGVLKTVNGSIQLGSVQSGQVGLTPTSQGWTFDYSNTEGLGDIQLTQQAQVSGFGFGNSIIQMQGRDISFLEGSAVISQNQGVFSSNRITINTTGSFTLAGTNPTGTRSSQLGSYTTGIGQAGDITISTGQLLLRDGAQIKSQNLSSGQGGNIIVNAAESISANGFNPVNPSVMTSILTSSTGSGKGGNVTLSTQKLTVANGATIGSTTLRTGNGGNVQIDASDSINVSGINNITFLPTVVASSTVGSGNAGNLTITTARLKVQAGSLVTSSTGAIGNAGNVKILASDFIEVSGTSPNTMLSSRIGSNALRLDPVTRATYGLPEFPTGNAGGVILITPQLRVMDRGDIGVKNEGTGNAGNFEVYADSILLTNRGTISATTQSGNGGSLVLNAQQLLLMRGNSKISVEAKEAGDGGNITLNAPNIVGLENSDIIANAVKGRGGNIQITTQGLFGLKFRPQLTPENDITASSQFGVSGTVQVNTIGVDPNSGLVELPANVTDPSQQIVTGCAGNQGNRFVATGRGGVPQNPNQQVMSDRTWSDTRDISAYRKTREVTAQIPPSPEILIQATSWHRNANGKVELIATQSPANIQPQLTCAALVKN